MTDDALYYDEVMLAYRNLIWSDPKGNTAVYRQMDAWAERQCNRLKKETALRGMFRAGQRVILKANKKEGWPEEHGFFVGMSGNRVAMVQVEPNDLDDDDGLREVPLSGVKPFYDHPTDKQRRARHAARQYKMGVRLFRLDKPDGKLFCLEAVDTERGVAAGRLAKRKTVMVVPLHTIWPNVK